MLHFVSSRQGRKHTDAAFSVLYACDPAREISLGAPELAVHFENDVAMSLSDRREMEYNLFRT